MHGSRIFRWFRSLEFRGLERKCHTQSVAYPISLHLTAFAFSTEYRGSPRAKVSISAFPAVAEYFRLFQSLQSGHLLQKTCYYCVLSVVRANRLGLGLCSTLKTSPKTQDSQQLSVHCLTTLDYIGIEPPGTFVRAKSVEK